MNIIFIHRNFPAQFRALAMELVKEGHNVLFITNNRDTKSFGGIKKIVYNIKRQVPDDCHRYLRFYEDAIIHGQAVAEILIGLDKQGFVPDVIIGHSWGNSMFAKEVFPKVPYISYFEWYYNPENSDVDFGGKVLDVDAKANLKCKNSHILQDLTSCDFGISPTQWQKFQFPKEFQDKITVIHEGIDTDFFKPDWDVKFNVDGIEFAKNDEILTYATRGMEEYRGFPEFMKTASILMKQRPNLHVIIAGEDRVCYGRKILNDTFKQKMLRELDFDMSRLHFAGALTYGEYLKLLQVSTCHVYLTYPFVLSWSFLEAMSVGCHIVASDTAPVKEVMQNGVNGILTDFYDIDKLVENVGKILDNPEKYDDLSKNARQLVQANFEQKNLLKKQIDFIKNCAKI